MERKNLEFENKPTSKFLNYLEFGFSVDLKDVTTVNFLDGTYLGIGISHRSGVFGLYNGVKGGSNYITYFLEKEF
jgi:outer membrane protein